MSKKPKSPLGSTATYAEVAARMPGHPNLNRATNALWNTQYASDEYRKLRLGGRVFLDENSIINLDNVRAALADGTLGNVRNMGKQSVLFWCELLNVPVDGRSRCSHCGQTLPNKINGRVPIR